MTGIPMVIGLRSEPPLVAVRKALARASVPHVFVDQRRLLDGTCVTWITDGRPDGLLEVDGEQHRLGTIGGVYTRLTSWAELPEVVADPGRLPAALALHHALEAWLEATPARVLNRTHANDSNNSKPYQALLIREYFDVPATLVTTDPRAVLAFHDEVGRLVYKSVSGERSIVTEFTDEDRSRLELLSTGPVQFQEYVDGTDVRVHVVGDRVFATAVDSKATDYRYDPSGGEMSAVEVEPEVAAACISLTRRLGLGLSGVDLRLTPDGRAVCFEANPSPAFTAYQDATGQPIADAIAAELVR